MDEALKIESGVGEKRKGSEEMDQLVKCLFCMPDGPSSVTETHIKGEGENQLHKVVF